MEQKPTKNKKLIQTIVGGVVAIGVFMAMQLFFLKTPSLDQAMMEAASEMNKSCPFMVDQETRLDNAAALTGNVFQYHYTLINMYKDSIDAEALQTAIEPNIINNVKTNPDLKIYRDNKVTMSFLYKDKAGNFLFKILITSDKYLD